MIEWVWFLKENKNEKSLWKSEYSLTFFGVDDLLFDFSAYRLCCFFIRQAGLNSWTPIGWDYAHAGANVVEKCLSERKMIGGIWAPLLTISQAMVFSDTASWVTQCGVLSAEQAEAGEGSVPQSTSSAGSVDETLSRMSSFSWLGPNFLGLCFGFDCLQPISHLCFPMAGGKASRLGIGRVTTVVSDNRPSPSSSSDCLDEDVVIQRARAYRAGWSLVWAVFRTTGLILSA